MIYSHYFNKYLSHPNEVCSSLLTADVILLLRCLEGKKLFGDPKVALQDSLLHTRFPRPLHLILVNENIRCIITSAPNDELNSSLYNKYFGIPKTNEVIVNMRLKGCFTRIRFSQSISLLSSTSAFGRLMLLL